MLKKQLSLCLIAAIGLLHVGTTSAATLNFDPTSTTANVGDFVDVIVSVSDLQGEVVSAFDLDVIYDPLLLSATDVQFTGNLGAPFSFSDFVLTDPGIVDFAELSLFFDFELLAIQDGDTVEIATLSFLAIGVGDSNLSFGLAPPGDDVKGLNAGLLAIDSLGEASISVVPIPGAALLMLTGLLGIRFASRKRNNEV